MDSVRLFVLAASLGGVLVGGLYAGARADLRRAPAAPVGLVVEARAAAPAPLAAPVAEAIPQGVEVPDEAAALVDAYAEEILDEDTGLRFGLTIVPFVERELEEERPVARRAARPRTPAAPIPRLHADPGRHVILTARGMMARNETVRGSCYAYLSEVFARAGHEGWRTRTIVHRSGHAGPYANLDQIRAGDWLYIVNHPESTPVGTHSVLFVGWEDRASGYARVIEHPGWGAGASNGRERGYDVSRTFRIVRPILARE